MLHPRKQDGFTLIEVVVSLIIMGFLGAVAGMGIVHLVDGYILAKESSETVQKSRIAMSRITKELVSLSAIKEIPSPSGSAITYLRDDQSHSLLYHPDSGEIRIDGDILLDNVQSFSLKYYEKFNDPQPDISDPSAGFSAGTKLVDVFLETDGPEQMVYKLETRIFLRGLMN